MDLFLFDSYAGGRENLKDFLTCIDREACLELFRVYRSRPHRTY